MLPLVAAVGFMLAGDDDARRAEEDDLDEEFSCESYLSWKFDFTEIAKLHTTNSDDVLNGIAFKGDNMLITGKNWNKIYEVAI